jgi:hypothetical protein
LQDRKLAALIASNPKGVDFGRNLALIKRIAGVYLDKKKIPSQVKKARADWWADFLKIEEMLEGTWAAL